MSEGYGFWGKILKINLSSLKYKVISLEEKKLRNYFLGSGLAALLFYKEYFDNFINYPALHPKNPLIILSGLFTGTIAPTACKVNFCGKSPLTGIWNESTAGGFWGQKLRASGYDGLIIEDIAEHPVYLFISDEKVEIKDAEFLWGKDVYQTDLSLKAELGKNIQTACIGIAGENLVKISGIMIGGHEGRAAGRGGLGALMGFKKLKAIVLGGNLKLNVLNEQALINSIKKVNLRLKENMIAFSKFGTAGSIQNNELSGDLPIKNFTSGRFEEGAEKTCGQAILEEKFIKHYGCFACVIRCGKIIKHKEELIHSPEYETVAGFGALCGNDSKDVIVEANNLCNYLGLDTISTSGVIAFCMELFEKGILKKEEIGFDLNWGNGNSILKLINQIALREDFGNLLGEGVFVLAKKLGGKAIEYAMHVKGLEMPYHDPRAFPGMALNYATANRGACHLEGMTYYLEGPGVMAGILNSSSPLERKIEDQKAHAVILMQNFMGVFNSLGICKFLMRGKVTPDEICNWINYLTGWEVGEEELFKVGERLFNLKRILNINLGISRKDDFLPLRFLTLNRGSGSEGILPHLGKMLGEYYKLRGWSEEGIPQTEKIKELGI